MPVTDELQGSSAAAAIGLGLFLAGRTCLQLLLTARQSRRGRKVGVVSQLVIYPVKSCLGVQVSYAQVSESGLVYEGILDRSFAVVSKISGKCVCLKQCPQLSRIQPEFDASAPAGIRLTCPTDPSRSLQPVSVGRDTTDVVSFDMYGVTTYGRSCSAETASWLRAVCGRDDLLLVSTSDALRTTIEELHTCQRLGIAAKAFTDAELPASSESRIAYANTAPLLITTEVAVEALNSRLAEKGKPGVDWRNFRPNLILSGTSEDREEEAWSFLYVGGSTLAVLSPCTRCGITTIDYAGAPEAPATLRSDGEPLRTLAEYRKDGVFQKFSPVFGVNGFVEVPGEVRVGCEVLASGGP